LGLRTRAWSIGFLFLLLREIDFDPLTLPQFLSLLKVPFVTDPPPDPPLSPFPTPPLSQKQSRWHLSGKGTVAFPKFLSESVFSSFAVPLYFSSSFFFPPSHGPLFEGHSNFAAVPRRNSTPHDFGKEKRIFFFFTFATALWSGPLTGRLPPPSPPTLF